MRSASIRLRAQFVPRQPTSWHTHCRIGGESEDLQRRYDEAAAGNREAIRLQPDYAEAHCNLGLILLRLGNYAESLPFAPGGTTFQPVQINGQVVPEPSSVVLAGIALAGLAVAARTRRKPFAR